MNKEDLLKMTAREIEIFLNNSISSVVFESEDIVDIKRVMISTVEPLFDSSIEILIPYYNGREIVIVLFGLHISFKVGAKRTNKTVEVTRLRKKYIWTVGKFKFSDITLSFYNPRFDALDLDNYLVKVSEYASIGGASISLKHRREELSSLLNKDLLWKEIEMQNDEWKSIRERVILSAAQPILKKEYFISNIEEKWDYILLKVEENNRELINNEIEKIFKININKTKQ